MRWLVAILLLLALSLPGFARHLTMETLPLGYLMSRDELIDNLPPSSLVAGTATESAGALRLPDMEATVTRREDPGYLLLSNAPELLDELSLPRRRGILLAAEVPAGKCRILVSHYNQCPLSEDFLFQFTNTSDTVADVVVEPQVSARQDLVPANYRVDAALGGTLLTSYYHAESTLPQGWRPPDGETRFVVQAGRSQVIRLVKNLRGMGMALCTMTNSTPLKVAVYAVPSGGNVDEQTPVLMRTGSQARGLFEKPDLDVDATVDVTDAVARRWVFGQSERNNALGMLENGNWMSGFDTTIADKKDALTNRGDYGGMTYFTAHVKGTGRMKGALFLLVCGGRKAAVLLPKDGKMVLLTQWNGLVVGRAAVGQDWTYRFSLPPNSWAPVYVVSIPLYTMPRY